MKHQNHKKLNPYGSRRKTTSKTKSKNIKSQKGRHIKLSVTNIKDFYELQ
jgi:hypothetical protein